MPHRLEDKKNILRGEEFNHTFRRVLGKSGPASATPATIGNQKPRGHSLHFLFSTYRRASPRVPMYET